MNLYVEDTISKYLMIDVDYVVESDDVGVGDLVVINSNVNVQCVAYSVESPGLLCLWQCIGMFSRTYYCCFVIQLIQIKILHAKFQESSAPFLNYDEPVTSFHCNA